MRLFVLSCALLAACALALPGCSKAKIDLDTSSTIRYDPARDGEPKDMGPTKGGGGKGKKGAGAGAPP